ncbi:MAG: hypothetical protein CL470_07885 [Acidimicrobiaceae bacterium]|nr:hypothetical protein [Acidimicrobiaceae bacterium]|tara:strand:+ start:3497 stop:6637 length:3141 start_codon:yes stop_codon:yes gene_type:complete
MGTQDELALLHKHRDLWIECLFKYLEITDRAIANARKSFRGSERRTILEDLNNEADRIDSILTDLLGPAPARSMATDSNQQINGLSNPALQLAWSDGRLTAWSAGYKTTPEDHEQILERLSAHGASAIEWAPADDLKLPGDIQAPCVSAPIAATLGWLVSLGGSQDSDLGTTAKWMGLAASTAVKLVIEGKMFPLLHEVGGTHNDETGEALFHIRWSPALLDANLHAQIVKSAPGAAMIASGETDRHKFTGKVIGDLTDSIVRMAASQVDLPNSPGSITSKEDVGEMIVSRLDGMAFRAPVDEAADIARRVTQWAVPVTGLAKLKIVVQLDPPDDSGTWLARVLVPNDKEELEPIEVTVTTGSEARRKLVNKQISRLERLFPELLRPGGRRRGEVLLSQSEAWELMSSVGETLSAAGYDVRVPKLTERKSTPILRITAENQETVVGAQQIADVKWTAVFDDVELDADQIRDLASQARPLVESKGQWVELDKADLAEAAAALAEHADKTQMSGAEMLRHALGLEGHALGGTALAGGGWAVDLLRSVKELPEDPDTKPNHFVGELRTYQADALAWLGFLGDAGLGGCLALDMGLGKTPTTLASIASDDKRQTSLVIAPPAVVGNWKAESIKFVPEVDVLIHHGPNRYKGSALKKAIESNDLIITTYGTAVRDIDELEKFNWSKIVLDEAQAIKNPAAETSKQLRRLNAHSRIALTGTPIENGLGDLWSILDWANPGLLGPRTQFIAQLTPERKRETGNEDALKALNGIMVYRRTKAEPIIAAELPDRIDELDHCAMTPEQIGLYQAIIDSLIEETENSESGSPQRKGAVLAAITALKQICNHPLNYRDDGGPIEGRSGKLDRLYEIIETVFAAEERLLVFTHFATWGERLAGHLSEKYDLPIDCYHGGLGRGARDRMVESFQNGQGAGGMVLSLKAGGTGLNLTAANHVILYDRWWNPAVEDQARDRVWRIGQKNTVIAHRLICPGTVDERVEEVVAGKRQIANLVLPKSSSIGDLDAEQLQQAFGIDTEFMLAYEKREDETVGDHGQ